MALVDVIKYDGGPDVFAWKFPRDDIGTWSRLVVNTTQEAILLKGGEIYDSFKEGTYPLTTDNIPILNKVINLPFGGNSPFKAEVWFINKTDILNIKWGTPTPVQVQDPKYNIFLPVRAFGQFGIQISDSRKFLKKLVGTLSVFNQSTLNEYFKGLYITKIKDEISSYLLEQQITVLNINAYLNEISAFMKQEMESVLEEYGISILNFYVNDINVPEDDPAVEKLKDALSKRAEMDIIGYNYQQERSFDTLQEAAANQGTSSTFMGAGMGLGMGVGLGGNMGAQMANAASNINTSPIMKTCPNCKKQIDENMKFCPECGADTTKVTTQDICICSKCGKQIPADAKFCPECGTPTIMICPKCNFEVKGHVKFCPQCGNKIEKEE